MPPNIIVIAIDRLGAGWLGPYGNTWVETPALNQFAAESTLCEFMLSDSCELSALYRSYLSGVPAWRIAEVTGPSLPQLAKDAGYETRLVTDAAEVAHHPLVDAFEQADLLTWKQPARTADEPNKTRLADVFSAAREILTESALSESARPKFLWIHAAAMNSAWDAPYELREHMTAEGDPEPLQFVAPPAVQLAKGYDPDELLGIVQAHAAEVMAIDENLATLLAAIDTACDPAETMIVVTSPRGYALGEHLRVGSMGDALRGELLQVPLLVRYPQVVGRLIRLTGLHQPIDLYSLVGQAFQAEEPVRLETLSYDVVVASAASELALRTRHWFYREDGPGEDRRSELYTKPDDRWEVNEISRRAADVTAAFAEFADGLRAQRNLPGLLKLPELPDVLSVARR